MLEPRRALMSARLSVSENRWCRARELEAFARRRGWGVLEKELRTRSAWLRTQLGLRGSPLKLERRGEEAWIRAENITGAVLIAGVEVEIVPKFIAGTAGAGDWSETVLTMLGRGQRKHYTYSRLHSLARRRASFVDHLALAYSDALRLALMDEPIHTYRTVEERSPFLRGRLSVERQVTSSLHRPYLLECEVDYRDTDNPYNRLLRWAGERLAALVLDTQVRSELAATVAELPAAAFQAHVSNRVPGEPPPQYRHYTEALEIATWVVHGHVHSPRQGPHAGVGFLFNTERLFEAFVERALGRAVLRLPDGFRAQGQVSRLYARAGAGSGRSYYTRPDNVIYQDDKASLLVDAKYKTLADAEMGTRKRPGNSDVYQLFASLVSHGCERGLLLYPLVRSDGDLRDGELRHWIADIIGRKVALAAVALDVSSLSTRAHLAALDQHLARTLSGVLEIELGTAEELEGGR